MGPGPPSPELLYLRHCGGFHLTIGRFGVQHAPEPGQWSPAWQAGPTAAQQRAESCRDQSSELYCGTTVGSWNLVVAGIYFSTYRVRRGLEKEGGFRHLKVEVFWVSVKARGTPDGRPQEKTQFLFGSSQAGGSEGLPSLWALATPEQNLA